MDHSNFSIRDMVKSTSVSRSEKTPLRKGAWSPEEDRKLIAYIKRYNIWNWNEMSKAAGLARSGKSCRLRWVNYLRPDIKHGNFSKEEEETIIKLHEALGNRWSTIAAKLPGRTDNEVKNYWHTHLKKRFMKALNNSSSTATTVNTATDELHEEKLPNDEASSAASDPKTNPSGESDQLSLIPIKLDAKSISKLGDSCGHVQNVPPQPQVVLSSTTDDCFSSLITGKNQIKINNYDHEKTCNIIDISDQTLIGELQSFPSGSLFSAPHEDSQQLIIGPCSTTCDHDHQVYWQQEPIWPYDFYGDFCYDWINYMDTIF